MTSPDAHPLLQRLAATVDSLWPPFLAVALEVLARCEERGVKYLATSGFRSFTEQTALWQRGRGSVGERPSPQRPMGYPVTAAKGGESAHNYGIALDVARDMLPATVRLEPGWRREDYVVLGEECALHGLVWGGSFDSFDGPHFQWPGYVTGKQMAPLRMAHHLDGLRGAWRYLDVERYRAEWQEAHPLLHKALRRLGAPPSTPPPAVA